MLKIFACIALACVVLLNSAGKLVVISNFYANRAFIAKNLCEKRAIANNCCKGSCHLKKQLEVNDHKNDPSANAGKFKIEQDEYCTSLQRILPAVANSYSYVILLQATREGHSRRIFTPPNFFSA